MRRRRPADGAAALAAAVEEGALALLQALVDRAAGVDLSPRLARLFRECLVAAFRLAYLRELGALSAGVAPAGEARPLLELLSRLQAGLSGAAALEEPFAALLGSGAEAPFAPEPAAGLAALQTGAAAAAGLARPLLATPDLGGDESVRAEGLGRAFELVAGLSAGLAREPMARLRRERFEAVLPAGEAERFRSGAGGVRWVEAIDAGRVFLRRGLARKSSGAYFTPPGLCEVLARETLGPLLARGPGGALADPLALRVLDPSVGAGQMLLAACRFLGGGLEGTARGGNEDRSAELDVRAAVARCCLHGVDLDPAAAEVARLALSLETGGRVGPAALSRHVLAGDAVVGPWLADLAEGPVSRRPLGPEARRLLDAALAGGPAHDPAEASVDAVATGAVDVEAARLTRGSAHALGEAWVDAVAAGTVEAEAAYLARVEAEAIRRDAGIDAPDVRFGGARTEAGEAARCGEATEAGAALCLDAAFPEVFGAPRRGAERGFDAVLGNPPWDKLIPLDRELHAAFDPEVLGPRTARERAPIYERLGAEPEVRRAREASRRSIERTLAFVARTYRHQRLEAGSEAGGRGSAGHPDAYRLFVERSWTCLREGGRLGLVLPAAVYSNQGSTAVRRLLLEESRLERCLGFTNRRRLFESAAGQRFALVVAARGGRTEEVEAAFGLEGPEDLEGEAGRRRAVRLPMGLVRRLSPEHLCLPECRSDAAVAAADAALGRGRPWGEVAARLGVELYQEMNMTLDSPRFARTAEVLARLGLPPDGDPRREPLRARLREAGWLVVHEKGTFHAYDDLQKDQPRYLCAEAALLEGGPNGGRSRPRPSALDASRSYRLALRATVHASEPDKVVACLLPPGAVVGNSALAERAPAGRPVEAALALLAMANSRPVGFVARLRVQTNVNKFILASLPLPDLDVEGRAVLVDAALRLTCRHEAYEPLWREVRGSGEPMRGAETEAERAALRAAVDGVVARRLGLTRAFYKEVLASSGRPLSPEGLRAHLAAFDRKPRQQELQFS